MTQSNQVPAGFKLTLAALAVLACSSAFAAEPNGWYAGGNIGSTRGHFDAPASITPFVGPGLAVTGLSEDNSDRGWKLYGGYRLNQNFAIEGGYFNLGHFNYQYSTAPAGTFGGELRPRGLNLDLVGIVPLGDRFSVFGRVGAAYLDSNGNYNRSGAVPAVAINSDGHHVRAKVGLGAQYAFTERMSVRAEIERYRVEDPVRSSSHVNMASVGLVYYFGDIPRTVAVAPAPAPVYVAPPPPPAPRVMAPPPPPPPVYTPPPAPAPVEMPPARPAKQGRN